ncbi:alpha/beta fold hydrolase [Ferrovibrio sp.]|uniref:alpha/beta hydrolase n=1 Tax=Ferrovibrio sp. TaxID=1917215 RepID=UPI00311F8258
MRGFVRYFLLPGFGSVLLLLAALAAAIVWGTAPAPAPLASINDPAAAQNLSALPARQFMRARDGMALAYRTYPGAIARAVILVHGSTADAASMHSLARALQSIADPPTVYALDMRGHGMSGARRGDIAYPGQLEDDLEDFLKDRRLAHPAAQWTLAGFSSGGGFALRIAGSGLAPQFRKFILLAPWLAHDAPTARDGGGDAQWAAPYLPRLVALLLLEKAGLPWFQDLPVLAFARRDGDGQSYTYSYRLWRNFRPHEDYAADLRAAPSAPVLLVGGADELLVADAFAPLVAGIRSDATVQVLPGLGHMDMIFSETAQRAVVDAYLKD